MEILLACGENSPIAHCGPDLGAAGHQPRLAHEGAAALALAREEKPELVVVEEGLAGLSATALVQALRQEPFPAPPRVALLRPAWDGARQLQALAAGVDHPLLAPPDQAGAAALLLALAATTARGGAGGDAARSAALVADLERSNQELKEFAYIISHDLKAPLRAIDSLVQWISEDYAVHFDEDGQEQMELLRSRVRRMQSLIEGVLHYSRIGRLRDDPVLINLDKLVAEVVDSLAPPPGIRVTVAAPLPRVRGEKVRIQQVFQNLLSNAIKYLGKPEGAVAIACDGEGAFWHFRVRDDGPGIDPKHHQRIFQIFQTLESRDEYESSGVGLTLVKKIVELHGGRVWVESAPGAGSTFHFTLPRDGERRGG